jgi:hypothetical protein
MYPPSPAGVMGTTVSRCHSLRALMPMMILFFQSGFATRNAINIGVHSQAQIQPESTATRTVSRSGPILEMVTSAPPLEMNMAEGLDMLLNASLVVKVMLLIMVIRNTIIRNKDAKNII